MLSPPHICCWQQCWTTISNQGNALNIDPRRIAWKRVVDMNDRELRNIVVGLGGKAHGVPRQDGFDITVASEVMAILCLASSCTTSRSVWQKLSLLTITTATLLPQARLRLRRNGSSAEGCR